MEIFASQTEKLINKYTLELMYKKIGCMELTYSYYNCALNISISRDSGRQKEG